jgi:hypothetical protein
MNWLRNLPLLTVSGALAFAADGGTGLEKAPAPDPTPTIATTSRPAPGPTGRIPIVLKSLEPAESRILLLPAPVRMAERVAPVPAHSRFSVKPNWHPVGIPSLPAAPDVSLTGSTTVDAITRFALVTTPPRPFVAPSLPAETAAIPALPAETTRSKYPASFTQESAVFCQRELGHWTLADARALLGEPIRQRAAIDDDSNESGHIFAFHDPTRRYRELELDFDKDKGLLRTVFIYPWNLTWTDCRKLWGTKVSATEGNAGRVFYSYVNRRLDVLVDHDGKVISLGLY